MVQTPEDLEIRGQMDIIQATDQPEYWEVSWRFKDTCCHSNSSEKPSANTGAQNSKRRNNKKNNSKNVYLGSIQESFLKNIFES